MLGQVCLCALFAPTLCSGTSVCQKCVLQKGRSMENKNYVNNNIPTITGNTTLGELIDIIGPVNKATKTPTSRKLREEGGELLVECDGILVYANGYAVYNNGSGRTVVWVPDCVSFTYHFNPLKPNEKTYGISETYDLPKGFLESQPWMLALTLVGDHRVEQNSMNRRQGGRKGTRDYNADENGDKDGDAEEAVEDSYENEYSWREAQIGEDPESIYIRKETRREMLERMTKKQREVFIFYYYYGYKQQEIADMLGTARTTIMHRLDAAVKKAKNIYQ